MDDQTVSDTFEIVPSTDRTPAAKPKWVLKRLTAKHRRIVNLKVSGLCREDVAKMGGCTPEYVSMLLNQPLVQEYLRTKYNELDQDLKDLLGPAVNTMRDMLGSADDKVALSAATTVLKVNGKLTPSDGDGGVTAEDIVAKLFQGTIGVANIQVNNYSKD